MVGQASSAIQKAAQAAGVQIGPTKETRGNPKALEFATIQIEGQAPTPAALQFLDGLKTLGVPLVVDSVQLRSAAKAPGQVQFTMNLVVLNYGAWKQGEKSRA